jgi:hypothetical protein
MLMSLVIPALHSNWILTMTNGSSSKSGKTTIAVGMSQASALTQADVTRIGGVYREALRPLLDAGWTYGPIKVTEGPGPNELIFEDPVTVVGSKAATETAPPSIAHVVSKFTGLSGRKHRGRLYFPGVPETEVDEGGILVANRINNVQGAFNTLRTNLIADIAITGVVLFHDEFTVATAPTQVLNFIARSTVGSMRPRQRR